MPRFASIIDQTKSLLNDTAHNEWIDRYQEYAALLSNAIPRIAGQRGKFRVPAPFRAYLNLTNTKGTVIVFQLRYLGQNVGELRYDSAQDEMTLSVSRYCKQNHANFGYDNSFGDAPMPWLGPEAKEFRAYFKRISASGISRIDGDKKNEEHRLESALYTEFEKSSAASKAFNGIEPVRFGNVRMGFPTPLAASRHGEVKYSGPKGGNVDILVRWGMPKSTLCAIELKDENKEGGETPEDVIEQGAVYAVFLRELLRCPCGEQWWNLFGFSGAPPKNLRIDAMCMMPCGFYDDRSFCGKEYAIGKDKIQLHVTYFTEKDGFNYQFVK